MAKPIEDRGHLAEATKPLKPRVYQSDRRPDPVQCAGCLITVCDATDAHSLHLEQSDGSRWRRLQFADEATQALTPVPTVDVSALAREAVARAIAEAPQPQVKLIAPAGDGDSESNRVFAAAMLEMSDHVNRLAQENADLMARVDYIERHALAAAHLKESA